MAKGGVNEKWTSKQTGDKPSKVREAFHDDRDRAREKGDLPAKDSKDKKSKK